MIGGPSFYAPDDGGEPCPDCCSPVQQVSVPDGKVCVPVEVLRLYEFMAASFTPFTSQHEQIAISLRKAKAAMLAAQAAPAADAHSWRRKEGVNGIKEFMAQKCYDAQTDAIKKYYEPFKCANCKAADAGLVEAFCKVEQALDLIGGIRHGKNVTQDELWQSCELLDAALAARRAKGVV